MRSKAIYPKKMEDFILASLGTKWREYKCYLKYTYFDEKASSQENMARCPPNVLLEHWQFLVNYWMSPAGLKLAAKGRKARLSQKATHITGSKSFAVKRNELLREKRRLETWNFI